MANNGKALDTEGIIDSAVSVLNKRYNPDNISAAKKQDLQTAVLEKLSEDIRYVIKSMFYCNPIKSFRR
jgi:hypothetical protein